MKTDEISMNRPPKAGFTPEQKEYLQGFFAGVNQRRWFPYAGIDVWGKFTSDPAEGGANLGAPTAQAVFGTPVSDLCKHEIWKLEENPLEIWDKLLAHAEQNKFPDEADVFRFRYHGLFYVGPAQNSFMLRCRIPGGELTSAQMRGLAEIAEQWGGGYADITTRSNLQIREIAPRDTVKVLIRLQEIGLTARGSGVDNVRNITASPTAGIDPGEWFDPRPLAKALHYYILHNRDLYGLPRKFNVAFDGGGAVSVVADTNDIGFTAVRVEGNDLIPRGIYFRVALAGITGHKQFAQDAGILVSPEECLALAAAMIRVFNENGDRTDRKKARLKYLIDRWGTAKFLEETAKKLAFPPRYFPCEDCRFPAPSVRHGHIGVHPQAQKDLNYIGVVIPAGRMRTGQMRALADLAEKFGAGELRLTPWQNLILPHIPSEALETAKEVLRNIGFDHEAGPVSGGLVACTGNAGCKWASTNTKAHAVEIGAWLESRVKLDQPINIHFTGCPHSCAQHYIGDLGLLGVKTSVEGQTVEAYNVVAGGGFGQEQAIGRELFKAKPYSELPGLLEHVLKVYLHRRQGGESFAAFTRRHETAELQKIFSEP